MKRQETHRQHTDGYKQSSEVEKKQRILDQCHVLPDTEALSGHRALPSETAGQILISSSAQLIYHGIFTSFPRHAKATDSDVKDTKTALSKMRVLKISDPPRNAHIIERNLEVLSWCKHLKQKKSSSVQIDDNIGENSLSSQSTYRQNLQDKLYLESLSPLSPGSWISVSA